MQRYSPFLTAKSELSYCAVSRFSAQCAIAAVYRVAHRRSIISSLTHAGEAAGARGGGAFAGVAITDGADEAALPARMASSSAAISVTVFLLRARLMKFTAHSCASSCARSAFGTAQTRRA